jgi:multiple sugar transport system permease protein
MDWLDPTVTWVPKSLNFDNFTVAFKYLDYWKTLGYTALNCIIPALISFFTCAVAGYGLARFKFKGRGILNAIMIICIMIPDPLIMIPSYNNFRHLDFLGIFGLIYRLTGTDLRISIINTPLVFIIPAILAVGIKNGLFIYIYSQFFKGLPKELEEAAWIDGAGPYKTFMNIVLPSSGASNITVLVFAIVWYWNDYYQAQIYLSDKQPMSVVLSNFNTNLTLLGDIRNQYAFANGTLLLTCCLIAILPVLIFFLFMQRKFVQSIATCGIVG